MTYFTLDNLVIISLMYYLRIEDKGFFVISIKDCSLSLIKANFNFHSFFHEDFVKNILSFPIYFPVDIRF